MQLQKWDREDEIPTGHGNFWLDVKCCGCIFSTSTVGGVGLMILLVSPGLRS